MNHFLRLVLRALQFPVVRAMDYANIRMQLHSVIDIQRLSSAHKEPETVRWIEKNMRDQSVFFDVGANVGAYSLIAAKVGSGKVFAFEPIFSTFSTLQENILINGCSTITPLNLALGEQAGIVEVYPSTLKSGGAQHSYSKGKNALRLAVMDMDTAIKVFLLPQPTMIKIDVDGYELPVLKGMTETIAHPVLSTILIELDATNEMEAFRVLETSGFKCTSTSPRGGGTSKNCIFER